MANRALLSSGWVAAAVFAFLTLSVFGALQSCGPESVVRKFHEAVAAGDRAAIQSVLTTSASDPAVQQLVAGVDSLRRQDARVQLAGADREPEVVNLQLVYWLADGRQARRVFVVRRFGRYWKIDAEASIGFGRRSIGL